MELSLLTFALMAMIVVMTPGPTVLMALSNGSKYGLYSASYGILGAALSDGILIAAAALGLGALLAASVFWFMVVKSIGVAYLIWIGLQMLRSSGTLGSVPVQSTHESAGTPDSSRTIFAKSFLVAATNPKGYLFFSAFLPQFLTPSEPLIPQYITLAFVFIAVDVAMMFAYAGLGAKAMQFLSDRGALWLDRTCGGFLVLLGLALAFVRHRDV
ncbi:LysE family translocator [uncultured Roseobacter sp.]|uniref:LysE family translocator n=1 Tax=uncultured Roseobacter sp. TaxID=114847 RepID=UPI002638114E|nr:LysE family translocator [uncultured Roseobacter sp.]